MRMIIGCRDKTTAALASGKTPKGFPADLVKRTVAMLNVLNAAVDLDDLRSPPGNRLEKLSGDRAGQHSVRVNKQFRICFIWTDKGPDDLDYH